MSLLSQNIYFYLINQIFILPQSFNGISERKLPVRMEKRSRSLNCFLSGNLLTCVCINRKMHSSIKIENQNTNLHLNSMDIKWTIAFSNAKKSGRIYIFDSSDEIQCLPFGKAAPKSKLFVIVFIETNNIKNHLKDILFVYLNKSFVWQTLWPKTPTQWGVGS